MRVKLTVKVLARRPANRRIRSQDTFVVAAHEVRMRGPSGFPIRFAMRCYHRSVVAPYAACRKEYPIFVYRISANRINLTRMPFGGG